MKPKILCIIPAREGSKGIKNKNIRPLLAKPLISWTIEEAQKSKYIDRIIISTDDLNIEKICHSYGAEVIKRPKDLAQDESFVIDVIIHHLELLKKENYIPEYVLLLQSTSPLRKSQNIDEAITKIINSEIEANSLVSVTKEEHPPWWLRQISEKGYVERYFDYDNKIFRRRQDFPVLYRPNGAIYIAKTSILYQYKSFQTNKTIPYVMDKKMSIDIDTENDLILAEIMMTRELGDE